LDFTIKIYLKFIRKLLKKNYKFQTICDFLQRPEEKVILFKHDIDDLKQNSIIFAKIQRKYDIKGTYYFRIIPRSYDKDIMSEISSFGHEVGYHYENISYIGKLNKGVSRDQLFELAIADFRENLEKFRKVVPVKTICMHGSPLSKYDNRELWDVYNYRDYGIIGEPYIDIDYNDVLYLTDTGRAWNTSIGNVRDKVQSKYDYSFKSTFDIIRALENDELPDKVMLNIHPQRWNNSFLPWVKELVWQNTKNVIKSGLLRHHLQ